MLKEFRQAMRDEILLPDARFLPKKTDGVIRWMWFFMRPYRPVVFASFAIRLFRNTAFALIIYLFSSLIDQLQSGRAFADQTAVWHNVIGLGIFYLIVLLGYMVQMYESVAVDKMARGLTLFSVRHLLALPLNWHEQKGSGSKIQRVMQARDNFRSMYFVFSRTLLTFFSEVIGLVITVTAMQVPPYMLLLFVGYIASYLAVSWAMTKPIDRLANSDSETKENLVSRVYDFISLIKMTKSFALDSYVQKRSWEGEKAGHAIIKKIRLLGFTKWTIMNLMVWIWGGAILVVGLHQVFAHTISIGAFAAIIFLAHRLWGSLEEVAVIQMDYFDYKNGFLRIRETLSVPMQNHDLLPKMAMPSHWSELRCEQLEYAYNERQPVLRGVDLVIPRGKRIALIGHSGAGKSTLVKLLMKQILPDAGNILVGDAVLQHMTTAEWLHHLALVPQDVELINATLRENILLDQQDISEDFYWECLRKAYLEEFVNSLPQGDRTEIGERGVKLSGGQRQRLGIARALARKAEIIIFDEATSSLDSESEAHIQKAMHDSFDGKTVIIIAHRLSTIREADIIYVMDEGRVAESGSFEELTASNGIFARLWAMQSGGFLTV